MPTPKAPSSQLRMPMYFAPNHTPTSRQHSPKVSPACRRATSLSRLLPGADRTATAACTGQHNNRAALGSETVEGHCVSWCQLHQLQQLHAPTWPCTMKHSSSGLLPAAASTSCRTQCRACTSRHSSCCRCDGQSLKKLLHSCSRSRMNLQRNNHAQQGGSCSCCWAA